MRNTTKYSKYEYYTSDFEQLSDSLSISRGELLEIITNLGGYASEDEIVGFFSS